MFSKILFPRIHLLFICSYKNYYFELNSVNIYMYVVKLYVLKMYYGNKKNENKNAIRSSIFKL